jgi:hypothetical protein
VCINTCRLRKRSGTAWLLGQEVGDIERGRDGDGADYDRRPNIFRRATAPLSLSSTWPARL